jgi:2-oxoglutarate ferredoxin oxidoreductase subunit delta
LHRTAFGAVQVSISFIEIETLRSAQGDKFEGDPMPAKGWIEVSDTYCKGCELCISACPQSVMELDMTRLTPKGYHPAHTFKDGCTGCAICALVCPDAAITVYREIIKAVPVTAGA